MLFCIAVESSERSHIADVLGGGVVDVADVVVDVLGVDVVDGVGVDGVVGVDVVGGGVVNVVCVVAFALVVGRFVDIGGDIRVFPVPACTTLADIISATGARNTFGFVVAE